MTERGRALLTSQNGNTMLPNQSAPFDSPMLCPACHALHSPADTPPAANSSAGVPCSMVRPCSMTTIRSQGAACDRRCAMTSPVRPRNPARRPRRRRDGCLPYNSQSLVAWLAGGGGARTPGPLLRSPPQPSTAPLHWSGAWSACRGVRSSGRSALPTVSGWPPPRSTASSVASPAPAALARPSDRRGDPALRARAAGRPPAHGTSRSSGASPVAAGGGLTAGGKTDTQVCGHYS